MQQNLRQQNSRQQSPTFTTQNIVQSMQQLSVHSIAASDEQLDMQRHAVPREKAQHHVYKPSGSGALRDEHKRLENAQAKQYPGITHTNKLEVVLSRYLHLDLSGRVKDLSTTPRGLGGFSDVFTASYFSLESAEEVKVSVKRLRTHIFSSDEKCQRVR